MKAHRLSWKRYLILSTIYMTVWKIHGKKGRKIMSDEFQNKYVGYMLLVLVLGVIGIGVIGIVYFAINGSY